MIPPRSPHFDTNSIAEEHNSSLQIGFNENGKKLAKTERKRQNLHLSTHSKNKNHLKGLLNNSPTTRNIIKLQSHTKPLLSPPNQQNGSTV